MTSTIHDRRLANGMSTALKTPYPEQLHTLELIRDGLNGDAYFIDTLYGPYMTAMLLLAAEPEFAGKKSTGRPEVT